jgi:hypothetical protein
MTKPNCYECTHRGDVPGSAHSCCNHPKIESQVIAAITFMMGYSDLDIRGNAHGIKSGWFMWPINFDPVWLENCSGFEPK